MGTGDDIPVNDAAQLTQHSLTASTTTKLVPVTTQRQDANSGVKCAVTTGKKATITQADQRFSNGVVHHLDALLTPGESADAAPAAGSRVPG